MKNILQLDIYGDHNLGLFAKTSDKFCILGSIVPEKNKKLIESVLGVKIIKATIANTDLIGMFCCINSNGIILPKIITEKEVERFRRIEKEFGINLTILKSKHTATGNLILCNDKGALISKVFTKRDKRTVEDCLDVEAEYCSIAGLNVVGSCGIATNKGCLLYRDVKEDEIKKIKRMLKVEADIGTANFGSPFVGACGFANSNAAIIGESTTGPEIQRLMEALGFI